MLKKSLSSMAVKKVVEEAEVLQGAFFQKAYQLDYGTLVLRFAVKKERLLEHSEDNRLAASLIGEGEEADELEEGISLGEGGGGYIKVDLYFKMGGFLFFSEQVRGDMPRDPSQFAMKLRKALKNRMVRTISQVDLDRVVVIKFNPHADEENGYELYLELFGDGNAILVKDRMIESPFTSRSWSSRTVKRGEGFIPPPSGKDPFKITDEEFNIMLRSSSDDLVRFLIRRVNLPPVYGEEICHRAGLEKKDTASSLEEEEAGILLSTVRKLLHEILDNHGGYVHFVDGSPSLIEPIFLSSVFGIKDLERGKRRFSEDHTNGKGSHYRFFPSINDAIERFMYEETAPLPQKERKKERAIDRLEKLLGSQEEALEKREKESREYRVLADALYTNYQLVDNILNSFDPEEYRRDPSGFPEVTSYTPDKRGSGFIKVRVNTDDGIKEAGLSLDRDINQNADLLYEMSKRSKKKLDGIEKAIEMTKDKMVKAQREVELFEEERDSPKKLRKFWFENFRWFFTSEKILVIGGRDAKTNERAVKKYMRDTDIYAHADISGASSVVIRIDKDQEYTEVSLEQGCHFSVLHSKAWHAKVGSAGAYWVKPDQVSRTPQSGEFVAKGSFIIRGKKNMVEKLPLSGAAGMIYIEGVPKVMFGPEDAILNNTTGTYFRIRPGKRKKSDVVKIISGELGGESEQVMSVLPGENMEFEKVERPDN